MKTERKSLGPRTLAGGYVGPGDGDRVLPTPQRGCGHRERNVELECRVDEGMDDR